MGGHGHQYVSRAFVTPRLRIRGLEARCRGGCLQHAAEVDRVDVIAERERPTTLVIPASPLSLSPTKHVDVAIAICSSSSSAHMETQAVKPPRQKYEENQQLLQLG